MDFTRCGQYVVLASTSIECMLVLELLVSDSSDVELLLRNPSWLLLIILTPSILSYFMLVFTSSDTLSLSVMFENLNDVLSVKAVVKLDAVVEEFIEYLCCFDRGLSKMSSLMVVFSHWVLGRCFSLLPWANSLLPHIIYSVGTCAEFCIVWMNGCVFFFFILLLCVDILFEGRGLEPCRLSSDNDSIALTFS